MNGFIASRAARRALSGEGELRLTSAFIAAYRLLGLVSGPGDAGALLTELEALSGEEVIAFDAGMRDYSFSWRLLDPCVLAKLRTLGAQGPDRQAWTSLALVSPDGFDRERAVIATGFTRFMTSMLVLRSLERVPEVRVAALARLAQAPRIRVAETLGLIELLAGRRQDISELDRIVEEILDDVTLRDAARSRERLTRRGAWRRLQRRGTALPTGLIDTGVRDTDPMVRGLAAVRAGELDDPARRRVASILINDHVGSLAARGLELLVGLDGPAAIHAALSSKRSTLRRHAQAWARIHAVDAREVYLARLGHDEADPVALVALADIGDPRDLPRLLVALSDERARVRAAALRAVARIEPARATQPALQEVLRGVSGRGTRAAGHFLRAAALTDDDLQRLVLAAIDPALPDDRRLRALALLQRDRWLHLATLLRARSTAAPWLWRALDDRLCAWVTASSTITHGPQEPHRTTILAHTVDLDEQTRHSIEFLLRTAA